MSRDETDRQWAEHMAPSRRNLLVAGALVTAGSVAVPASAQTVSKPVAKDPSGQNYQAPAHEPGKSPWGYETYKEPTPQPVSVRPHEQTTPSQPRPYTDIKSYHAHIYFDEDNYEKAALLRKWVADRFVVELGNWNLEPRGPHVTPSYYFGFTNDLLPVIVPWLQLNSLGLTILLHPNSDDPRADHLYYTLWINRTQPVNAYGMPKGPVAPDKVEQIYPNTRPGVPVET
jgi:aromatic ring-cleaving dioxygenase